MGDMADMLGVARPAHSVQDEATKIFGTKRKSVSTGPKKPKGMKREVYDLLGSDSIIPAVQSNSVTSSFKSKRQVSQGKWVWSAIENSARSDNPNPIFYHWIKAEMHYSDYPYAKYNVTYDKIEFTDEEYNSLLKDENWTKEDTELLLETTAEYALRWPVIYDRINLSQSKSSEQLMARYYFIVKTLEQGTNKTLAPAVDKKQLEYDLEKETKRRKAQDTSFRR
jgi:hypothetical protein